MKWSTIATQPPSVCQYSFLFSSHLPCRISESASSILFTGLGFNIRGGLDNIHVGNDPGIFVTTVKPTGAAGKDGRLHPGDKILEVYTCNIKSMILQRGREICKYCILC